MRLQLCDGIKRSRLELNAVLIFLTALVFLYRPVMAAGFITWAGITIFTEGLFVLLALGFVLFRWETLRETLKNTDWCSKVCLGILLAMGLLHWLIGGYYRPEYLGLSLFWGVIPLFGAVYRNELERKLPAALGLLWLLNVIVCIGTESFTGSMFGITGNWNWSSLLLLITFPFALRCLPPFCKGRKIYLAVMWLLMPVLLIFLQSRAVVVSAAAAWIFWIFLKFRKLRIPMIICGILFIIAAVFAAYKIVPEKTNAFLKREIRVEYWKSAVELIRDVPVGVGVVSFENAYIPYRSEEYFKNPHCAVREHHPHNELLYIAATLGLGAVLAFIVWIIRALVGAVREYDSGMSRKRVLFLLGFIAVLCNCMLDLTLHIWPTGILGLLFFGMFAFPGKRVAEKTSDGPANRIGKTVFWLTILFALANLIGTFCWEASHISIKRMNIPAAKKYAKTGLLFAPEIPNLVYRSANDMAMRDLDFSLELVERLQNSPWENYAHLHGLKSLLYRQQKKYEEAIRESLREAELFPLQIRPIVEIVVLYGYLGVNDPKVYSELSSELQSRIKKRNLTPEQIQAIYKNPEYDMYPHRIGVVVDAPKSWKFE